MSATGRAARTGAGVVALAATLALVGCGIPVDSQPRTVGPLVTPTTAVTTLPPSPGPGSLMETLYLVRDDVVVPVTRPVEQEPTPQTVLADLAAGANTAEKAQGLSSVLAGTAAVQGVGVDKGLATVALGEGLDSSSDKNPPAMAQIVCTLNALPDIDQVVFTRNGVRASVPRGDGQSTPDPVTCADYAQVLEPH